MSEIVIEICYGNRQINQFMRIADVYGKGEGVGIKEQFVITSAKRKNVTKHYLDGVEKLFRAIFKENGKEILSYKYLGKKSELVESSEK